MIQLSLLERHCEAIKRRTAVGGNLCGFCRGSLSGSNGRNRGASLTCQPSTCPDLPGISPRLCWRLNRRRILSER